MDGFYRIENGQLAYSAADVVVGPGYQLIRNEHDSYTYPVEGWVWGASRAEAKRLLGLAIAEQVQAQRFAQYKQAVQALLDDEVTARGFDNVMSAISYAESSVEAFREDARAVRAWRDELWLRLYQTVAAVQTQNVDMPSVAAFVAGLPAMSWPVPQEQQAHRLRRNPTP